MRDISDMGLRLVFFTPIFLWLQDLKNYNDHIFSICMQLVKNVAEQQDPSISSAFYNQYFLPILQDLFYILTDSEHKGGKCLLFVLYLEVLFPILKK